MKVFDASAVLAFLLGEPGGPTAARAMNGAYISSVNAAEVYTRLARLGVHPDETAEDLSDAGLSVLDATEPLARTAGELSDRPGLSIGDRFCIALAQSMALPVVTSDRIWDRLDLPVTVELIR